jgi:hypothetical protein
MYDRPLSSIYQDGTRGAAHPHTLGELVVMTPSSKHAFATRLFAVLLLCLLAAIPVGLGTVFLLDPLREDTPTEWARVAELTSIPDDGIPHRFPVYVSKRDAWTRLPDRVIGSVYLTRSARADSVTALRATHHSKLFIPVEYDARDGVFESVCWNVRFSTSGVCLDNKDGMEDLESLRTRVVDGIVLVVAAQQ